MLVSMTVTPVLCYYLLPRMKRLEHGDGWLVARLKRGIRGSSPGRFHARGASPPRRRSR